MKSTRKLLKTLVIATFALMFSFNADANPAFPHAVTVKQSNGKELTYFIYGDEHVSWAKTLDGYMIMPLDNGDFVYAVTDSEGNMVPSQMIATNTEIRSAKEKQFVAQLNKQVFYSQQQVQSMSQKRFQRDEMNKKKPLKAFTTDKPKLMVILVNYTDVTISETNAERFKHQIQDSNYTSYGYTGSVRDYFADQSFGTIDPQFEVFGPVTLPHNRAYYAQNNNNNAWQMARDAVKIIDTMYNVDFSEFDNDNDGNVDLVHIIYAGLGSNSTGNRNAQVWPHMFYFGDNTTIDGKKFYRYACSSETSYKTSGYSYSETIDGIGAVCHEMGHAFGLPDMYATDYGGSITPASWDVMDAGSYNNDSKTPPYYSMIERDMIGWGNIVNLTEGEHKLYPIADSNTAYKIHLNNNEYLMFEYRNHDKWDAYTKGIGMLVWHADTSKFVNWELTNDLNNDPDDRGYFIECAGNESNLESKSTPYPGSLNKTTTGYFKFKNGNETNGLVSDIHYDLTADSTIIFTYKNSYDEVLFELNIEDISLNSVKAVGKFTSSQTMSNRVLQYKKTSQTAYTSVDLSSDNISYVLSNLEKNTKYNIRLCVSIDGTTYYGPAQLFQTACYDGKINEWSWSEGFENGLNCWTIQSTNNASWKTAKKAISGQVSARYGSYLAALTFTQSYYSNSTARLISPVFDLSGYESAQITFSYAVYSGVSNPLTLYCRVSENGTWAKIASYSNTTTSSSVTWKTVTVDLPQINDTYQISFVAQDNAGYGVALDGIQIKGTKKSALNDAQDASLLLSVMPNPSINDATLQLNGFEGQTTVTVTDVMGRVVEQIVLNANETTVNLNSSSYESGVYYIRANDGEKNVVEKFVKK